MRTKLHNQAVVKPPKPPRTMMRQKLNNQVVVKLEPPTGAYKSSDKPIPYVITWDTDVAGFGALVTRTGRKSFVFNYRNRVGTERRIKIGDFPTWSVSVARGNRSRTLRASSSRRRRSMATQSSNASLQSKKPSRNVAR